MLIVYNTTTNVVTKTGTTIAPQMIKPDEIVAEYFGVLPDRPGDYKFIDGELVARLDFAATIEDTAISVSESVIWNPLPPNTRVLVATHGEYTITDGEFIFSSEEAATYVIAVEHPDYKPLMVQVTVYAS